ncbi:HIRAN domain-containing protein [Salinivibrio sp. VYel1]|uniref:HIRAN domain-containing protein n=1 Tax=Salinivibrio sp. VYel1 TaxID=2490490 RepID=UPI00128BB32E|nr:HIRAN domain-containing protein [Salinivibrio sp. VYel1]MPX91406.1 restriction endonuclease [Salinivibrio sp. VYel1]
MNEHEAVYLAWQSPDSRDWYVIGALTRISNGYEFHYTKGALYAEKFVPFSGMEDLYKSYVSSELFPLFQNRVLSSKRPEYPRFIKWLGLSEEEATPINILARSGGLRSTDRMQMFRKISTRKDGSFEHFFFVHGLSYLTRSAQKRVETLEAGEALSLCLDCQNKHDENAVIIRADNPAEIVGYCPRYLAKDIAKLLNISDYVDLTVEKIEKDAPVNYQLMCKVSGRVSESYSNKLDMQEEYEFIV